MTIKRLKLISIFLILIVGISYGEDEFFQPKTTIGGYGELHYNYELKDGENDAAKTLDFHRFIIFYSHAWTEHWSIKSEVELEHNFVESGSAAKDDAGTVTGIDGKGELELEQAFINYHHSLLFGFKAGVILASAGLINEFHEPPLFLSVERPDYAKNIIPTTWFGNGIGVYGTVSGFEYKLNIMEGLDGSKVSNGGIRSGRNKGYKADADQFLYNGSIDFTGLPGLRGGVSYSYNYAKVNAQSNIGIHLMEGHIKYDANDIYAAGEVGYIMYDQAPDVESSLGYYLDIGYNLGTLSGIKAKIIPWVRWSEYNTANSTVSGGDSEKANHYTKWTIGLSLKPIPQVVFKMDFGVKEKELGSDKTNQFNVGAGYMF